MNLFSKKKNDELRISMPTYDGSNKCKHIRKELVNEFKVSLTINNYINGTRISWFIVKPENCMEKYDVNELTEYLKIFPWV